MSLQSPLRALLRDPLYAGAGILALAIGLAAALFTGLYIRDELSFDRFIPGHDTLAVLVTEMSAPGQADISMDYSPGMLSAVLRTEVPGVRDAGRLAYDDVDVRSGDVDAHQDVAWVDPDVFDLLPLPLVEGDLGQAARSPDGAVLTQGMARTYFGAGKALGASLRIDGDHVVQVRAVIRDLPAASHLSNIGLFLAGTSATSPLTRAGQGPQGFYNAVVDFKPATRKVQFIRERTYVRLAAGADLETVNRSLATWSRTHAAQFRLPPDAQVRFQLIPLTRLHTYPFKGANLGATDVHTDLGTLANLGVLGGLVLLLAATNFVNLSTARSTRRALEVGVRKAVGASRIDLVRQFCGEIALQVVIATALALMIVEDALPSLNGFLMKDMTFDYWRDPAMAGALLTGLAVLTLLSGAYPAFVLSSFRPAAALKGGAVKGGGSTFVREAIVAFQFCALIVLLLGAAVVWMQVRYASHEGLRLNKDGVLVVHTTPCRGAFAEEVRRLPGVVDSGCASQAMLGLDDFNPISTDAGLRPAGRPIASVSLGMADFHMFQTLGIAPLAGRLFLDSHKDVDEFEPYRGTPRHGSTILNETAVRRLGFARPSDAVGQVLAAPRSNPGDPHPDLFTVIGVVPDFTLDLRSAAVKPTAYLIDPDYPMVQVLAVRLRGRQAPETIKAIDRLWTKTGHVGAPHRQFLDDYVQRLYVVTTRQAILVSALCAIAAALACAGLLALAAYTAQRRTKEIGIRKVMGASTPDILRLLLLQFSRPVGVGILVGTPVGYAAARYWLAGFTYRIALEPWLFGAVAAVALLIGLGAVLLHATAVARARPANALRYE